MSKRLKVLISAYACEPGKGSEPGVGFNLCRALSGENEVHVITRENNRISIDLFLKKNPPPNLHFHYYDPHCLIKYLKKNLEIFLYPYYVIWQIGAFLTAYRLTRQIKFDIAHHLTFGNIWMPTSLVFLKLPFIWGPVGGGEAPAAPFIKDFPWPARVTESLRMIILKSLRFNPFFYYACHKAACIVVKTKKTTHYVPQYFKTKCLERTDVGVYPEEIAPVKPSVKGFRVLMVGTLEPWRGCEMGIRGFAHAARTLADIELVIVGSGKDEKRLRKICQDEGIACRTKLSGAVSYEKYREHLRESSIILNMALKEGGVTFFFDALSAGKPIINLDIPGSAQINKEGSGVCIPANSPGQVIADVGAAIIKLYFDSDMRKNCSDTACRIALKFHTWKRRAEAFTKIYESAINQ